jgi:hypothetical protein
VAKSEQQRQKKLAKKRSKEIKQRRELAQKRQVMASLAGQMQWASSYPVHSCYIGDAVFSQSGLGVIFFTRTVADGRLAVMFLLIDTHCLGVKDAGGRLCTPGDFAQMLDKSQNADSYRPADPARARKLTEDAIAYAQSIGFSPHPDYRNVAPLWGDIDASACSEVFTFGVDGKPSYFAGPNDDMARQNLIFRTLCQSVGEGNFHFTVGGPGLDLSHFDLDDLDLTSGHEWTDDEEEDEDDDTDQQHYIDSPGWRDNDEMR